MTKKAKDTIVEHSYSVTPRHINGYGRLFGGQLMMWIDQLAGIICKRYSECEVTTASVDNLSFKSEAKVNDTVVLVGRITYVGHTSMEVRIDTYVENLNGIRKLINRAYIVMVAIDKGGIPLEVPRLLLETINEHAEWEAGERRYMLRKQRHVDGF